MNKFEETIRKNDMNEIFHNGTFGSYHCGADLPDFRCHNGETIKVSCKEDYLFEIQAKVLINHCFGFEMSAIKIIPNNEGFFGFYNATDYNYVRFEIRGRLYDMINDDLDFVLQY